MLVERRFTPGPTGQRHILVVAPDEDELVGSETLAELRSGRTTTLLSPELRSRVDASAERVDAVVLRARGADGSGQFRVDRSLEDAELEELGYLLMKAQLDAWRPALQAGRVLAIVRVELRVWELAALRSGTARLLGERERESVDDDVELLQHHMINLGVGLDTALRQVLPRRLERLEAAQQGSPTSASFG